ncbi:hypothetical protein E3N88_14016 [Mikania micrantha]|uniref:DM8 domain-containing protein n=1 Tax=Mikania micrantha TaxID=192012 RepID=A0A5N6P2W1_9ASTR|nr:hypothetical protein E3N88_14016 [Mikania micrantha]
MGLIMGGMVLREDLDSAVRKAMERANDLRTVNGDSNPKLITDQNEINLTESGLYIYQQNNEDGNNVDIMLRRFESEKIVVRR